MKNIFYAVPLALLLCGPCLTPAQAQSALAQKLGPVESHRAFNTIPPSDPAYKCMTVLQNAGIAISNPGGTNTSLSRMTGYEFGVAIARLLAVLMLSPNASQNALQNLQQDVQNKLLKNPQAFDDLMTLISEFMPEIEALGVNVADARCRLYDLVPHPFETVPADDPAWGCLTELQEDGFVLHLNTGLDLHKRSPKVTRYEFACSIVEQSWLLSHRDNDWRTSPQKEMEDLEIKLKQNPRAAECLLSLLNEYRSELIKLGEDVPEAKRQLYAISPFTYIPSNDAAFQALGTLQDAGLVSGYDMELSRAGIKSRSTTGMYSGNGRLTPYQFALAVIEAYPMPLPGAKISARSRDSAERRTRADAILAGNPAALQALQSLTDEFRPCLEKLGQDVPTLNAHLAMLVAASRQLLILAPTPFPDVPKDHWAYPSVEAIRKLVWLPDTPPTGVTLI